MTRIHPERRSPSDQSVIADLILRQEPDEEEDEDEEDDEGDGKNDDDDDRDDSGYSEKEIGSIESYTWGSRIQLPIPIQRSLLNLLLV